MCIKLKIEPTGGSGRWSSDLMRERKRYIKELSSKKLCFERQRQIVLPNHGESSFKLLTNQKTNTGTHF